MFSFLSPDSRFMQVLNRISDLVILNVLYLLTCLPVFTIGAARAAMYTLCFQMLHNREAGVVKPYFRAFRSNFRQGTLLWLLALLAGIPALYYFAGVYAMDGAAHYLFLPFSLILALIAFTGSYVFPWISQFHNSTGQALRNALLLSISHLPRTLGIAGINLLPWMLLLVFTELFFSVSFLWLVLYFAAAAYLNALILRKVFAPYYPEENV